MLILKFLFKFIGIMNKDASPQQIAGGMALGSIMGITPFMSLHNLIVLFLILMIRVNITSAFVSLGIFKLFSYLLDPLFNKIGYYFLVEFGFLKGFWTALYNTPIFPWSNFNNTLTLGSFIFSLMFFWPLYLFLNILVKTYREKVMEKIKKWKIVQAFKVSKIYQMYSDFS